MMKKLFVCLLGFAPVLSAVSDVTDVAARQRWPWDGNVDISFNLTAKADVSISATWDGQAEPVDLGAAMDLNLTDLDVGRHVFTWTPPANETLTNFRVAVETADLAARKYLVVDLWNNTYEFRATPDSNWDDDIYRTRKMVFARIPAGTYTLGLTQEQLDTAFPDGSKPAANTPAARQLQRQVKISHDYYMASFLLSAGQITSATNTYPGTGLKTASPTYNQIRGSVAEGIDWPRTKHCVAQGSIIDGFRKKLTCLPKGWVIDLPTSAQWEIAARCGTTTVFPTDTLTAESTKEDYLTYLNARAWWKEHDTTGMSFDNGGTPIGYLADNPWGVRDTFGFRVQVVADWYDTNNNFKQWPTEVMVDPVGPETANNRETRSNGMAVAAKIGDLMPTRIGYVGATGMTYLRLCIDTHALFAE